VVRYTGRDRRIATLYQARPHAFRGYPQAPQPFPTCQDGPDNLFPYLKGFRTRAQGANTIEYKIGEIFSEIENKFRSGYSLRDALELGSEPNQVVALS
jgi:hypothetical protein